MYDNTDIGNLVPIASKMTGRLEVQNALIWQNLVEMYDELSKNEDKISQIMNDSEKVRKIIQSGINDFLLKHKQARNAVCGLKNGKVFWVGPQDILINKNDNDS